MQIFIRMQSLPHPYLLVSERNNRDGILIISWDNGHFDRMMRLLSVTGKYRIVSVDPAVTEERPPSADIFSAVDVDVNHLHTFLISPELRKDLPLRPSGE